MTTDRESRSGGHRQGAPLKVTTYSTGSAVLQPRVMVRGMIEDLKASRGLAWRLAVRDIQAQYRQSLLGYLWAFILPLANTVTWIFLNNAGIVRLADTSIPYPAYVFTGTMLWQLFIEALQSPLQQVTAAKAMLAKLNFPREALILSGIIRLLSGAGVKLLILLPAIMFLGVMPDWHLLLFPFSVIALIIVGVTIGLFLAPLGILYNDIGRAIPILAQFAMYITPVVFAMPVGGLTLKLFKLNFLTPLILTSRAWCTGEASPMFGYFLGVSATFTILLMVAWMIYRITMPLLIERMGS